MSTQIVGTIPTFSQGNDDWKTYSEILDQFFIVNNVEDDKKSAFLISCIGSDTYKTLRDLCHPVLPKDKKFEDLSEILRKQFSPQVAIFRERTNFYNAKQNNAENVTSWYGRVKRLSVDCKFGDNLEAILLDKFITGLRVGQVLDRLCEENETLTLQQAVDIATNKECSLMEVYGNHIPAYEQYNQQAFRGPPRDGSECSWRGKRGGGKKGGRGNKKGDDGAEWKLVNSIKKLVLRENLKYWIKWEKVGDAFAYINKLSFVFSFNSKILLGLISGGLRFWYKKSFKGSPIPDVLVMLILIIFVLLINKLYL